MADSQDADEERRSNAGKLRKTTKKEIITIITPQPLGTTVPDYGMVPYNWRERLRAFGPALIQAAGATEEELQVFIKVLQTQDTSVVLMNQILTGLVDTIIGASLTMAKDILLCIIEGTGPLGFRYVPTAEIMELMFRLGTM